VVCPECGADLVEESRKPFDHRAKKGEQRQDWEPFSFISIANAIGMAVVCFIGKQTSAPSARIIYLMVLIGVVALCVVGLLVNWRERSPRPGLVRWLGVAALAAVPGVWILMGLLTR
jgi:hypothetical protein